MLNNILLNFNSIYTVRIVINKISSKQGCFKRNNAIKTGRTRLSNYTNASFKHQHYLSELLACTVCTVTLFLLPMLQKSYNDFYFSKYIVLFIEITINF